MSIPRSPSVPTIMGSSVSSLPMRSTAGASLIVWFLLVRGAAYPSAREPLQVGALAYGGPVAVAERDLTTAEPPGGSSGCSRGAASSPRGWCRGCSRSSCCSSAVNDPARGSRFVQVATRWDGAFYLDIARNGYGPGQRAVPQVAVLPAPARPDPGAERGGRRQGRDLRGEPGAVPGRAGRRVPASPSRHGGPTVARLSTWALALFPASFVFSMTYPSAIFLAASVWAFVLVEERPRPRRRVWWRWARRWCGRTALVLVVALVVAVRVVATGGAGGGPRRWWRWPRGASGAGTAPATRSCSSPRSRAGRRSRSSGCSRAT